MTRPLAITLLTLCGVGCGTAPEPAPTPALQLARPSDAVAARAPIAQQPPPSAAPGQTTLPLGVGFTGSPGSFLVGGAMDFSLDRKLTAGPAVQFGFGDKTSLFTAVGQLKYWLLDDAGSTLNPFLQGGVGVAYLDRDGRGSDWSPLLNVGGGVRLLTGDHYRIGSTALVNFTTSHPADTSAFFTWEIIQVVFDF